jgi:3-hydroxybutyryl-CoA dehydrogenase
MSDSVDGTAFRNQTVGIIGGGVMGCDLAYDAARHGGRVILVDLSDELLEAARRRITTTARMVRLTGGPPPHPATDELDSAIRLTTDLGDLGDATVVIENIIENIAAKRELYAGLGETVADVELFGVDSSCIPVSTLAELLPHPEVVAGMHLFNPVPLTRLVEIVRGRLTSNETLDRARAFASFLGKRSVVVNDGPGYAGNRVLMLTINEAVRAVDDGIASPADLDTIFRDGFSHRMGPLATADLIGLDTILASLEVLLECTGDPRFEPSPTLRRMVADGRLGRKTGRGFFPYGGR